MLRKSQASVRRLVADVVSKHGRLDVLVNAVGGYAAGRALWDMDAGALPKMLSLNLTSGYVLCRAVVPAMLGQKRGAIINVASMAAVQHAASSAEYSASKAAAVAMIDSMAADLSGTGVCRRTRFCRALSIRRRTARPCQARISGSGPSRRKSRR